MPASTATTTLPAGAPPALALGDGVALASRNLMLDDLERLFDAVPPSASPGDYREAIVEANVLLKPTQTTRVWSFKFLRRLYALDPAYPLFGPFRRLWAANAASRPLLVAATALVRDALYRATADQVLGLRPGEHATPELFERAIRDDYAGELRGSTLKGATGKVAAAWTQTGHLSGLKHRVRARVTATPAATAYAMLVGHLLGARGLRLLETPFARLLDAPAGQLDQLAFAASQRGWLEYRRIGDVAEFGFNALLGASEDARVEG